MAWRAASCTASRSLYLGRAIPAVSTSSSFSSSFCAQSLRNPCRRARAPFKIQVRGRHAESTLEPFKIQVRGRHAESTLEPEIQSNKDESSSMKWKIKMLYDGECPLCMREVNMLRERNKLYGAIKFVDISSKDYTPEDNQGLDYRTVMGRIHAILSDGTVVTDVEAFRRLYEEVGLGWVYAITKYEPVASIANAVYGAWAKYRLQITGRPPLKDILASRKGNTGEICNDDKVCRM